MAVKKKTGKATTTSEAIAGHLEEDTPKSEKRSPFTQVVEVVEEEPQAAPSAKKVMLEDPVPVVSESTDIRPEDQKEESRIPGDQEESAEKKRELVDELFQKKGEERTFVSPEISMHTKSTTKPVYLWAIGLVVACLVIGGTLLLSSKKISLPSIVIIPTLTPTSTPAATVTPTPGMTRDALSIQVLNGGGKAGAATKMKKFLEDKGYKVTDTGNADNYNYDKTEILVKSDKKQYLSLLSDDLKDTYSLGTSAATLEADESYDARVIVGKE